MRKLSYKIITILMILMVVTSCSASKNKADTKEAVQALTEEFFDGLVEQERYTITNSNNGNTYSVATVDGDKIMMHYEDPDFPDYYMFMENGVKYSLYDGGEPYEDEAGYDMNADFILGGLRTYTDAILSNDDPENKYEGTLSKNGDEKELKITVKTKSDAGEGTTTLTGKSSGEKIMSYSYETVVGGNTMSSQTVYGYGDDIAVVLPEYEIPVAREYTHIESPYATMGDVIDKVGIDSFVLAIEDGRIYTVADMLQLSGPITDDVFAAYDAIDPMADDFNQKAYEVLKDLPIDDCIDFSEYVLSEEDLDAYAGKSVEELVNDGFEENGWSVFEGDSNVLVEKDGMVYEFNVGLPEGFDTKADIEFSDLYGATVKDGHFSEISMAMIPLK